MTTEDKSNFVGTDVEKQTNTAQDPPPIMTPSQFSATQSAMYEMQQNPTSFYQNTHFEGTEAEKQTNTAQDPPPIMTPSQFSAAQPAMYAMQQNPTTIYQNTHFVGTDVEKKINMAQNPQLIMTPSQFSATQSAIYAMQQNPTTSYINTPYCGQHFIVVVPEAVPDDTPPPNTTCSLILSIFGFVFCCSGWMCAVVALYLNRQANSQKQRGQNTAARKTLLKVNALIAISFTVGIISWVLFGIYFKEVIVLYFNFLYGDSKF